MRDHAARQKPMTATATRMVKAIWHAYFVRTGIQLPGETPVRLDVSQLCIAGWGMPALLTLVNIQLGSRKQVRMIPVGMSGPLSGSAVSVVNQNSQA